MGEIPANFFDERADGFRLLREVTLSSRRTRREFTSMSDVAFIQTDSNTYTKPMLAFCSGVTIFVTVNDSHFHQSIHHESALKTS